MIALAVALIARGATKHHGVRHALSDVYWLAVTGVLYVILAYLWHFIRAHLRLKAEWQVGQLGAPRTPLLIINPTVTQTIAGLRCEVETPEGETLVYEPSQPEPLRWSAWEESYCHYPSSFWQGVRGFAHGPHVATWFIREQPEDEWIKVATFSFVYDPLAP